MGKTSKENARDSLYKDDALPQQYTCTVKSRKIVQAPLWSFQKRRVTIELSSEFHHLQNRAKPVRNFIATIIAIVQFCSKFVCLRSFVYLLHFKVFYSRHRMFIRRRRMISTEANWQFSHDVTKIQITKLLILPIYYFNDV